jgi:hypothetical protein
MPRPPRRLVAALLWVVLALLPLRGFAAALMPLAMAHPAPAAAAHGDAAHDTAAEAMPCHSAMESAGEQADGDVPLTQCAMCDLCHAGVMQAAAPGSLPDAPPQDPPAALASAPIEARAPDALLRPPRTDLA